MKKLLITGFEPFGGDTVNPSWDAVCALPDEVGEYTLTKLRIPVVFGEAARCVIKEAESINPDVILCIGQAGGRAAITPEFIAINLKYAKIPDNNGNEPKDEPVICGGESALFSTIPVRKIVDAISNAGVPSQVSYSAGLYVCNDVLYTLLDKYKDNDVKIGFIHVPCSEKQNKEPCMKLADIVKGVEIAISSLDE